MGDLLEADFWPAQLGVVKFRVARDPLVMGHRQLRHTGRFLTNNDTSQISFAQGRFVTPEIELH